MKIGIYKKCFFALFLIVTLLFETSSVMMAEDSERESLVPTSLQSSEVLDSFLDDDPTTPPADQAEIAEINEEVSTDAETVPNAPSEEVAQPVVAAIITDVQIRGNQLISTSTIRNKLTSQPGAPLRQEKINEDIKRLFKTGFFQDVKFEVEPSAGGYLLILIVDEKPIIKTIVIEGNKLIKTDRVRKKLVVVEGQILDPKLIKEGVLAIEKIYAEKGFRFVKVDWEMDVNEYSKEATILISIDEGSKIKIKEVAFEGNSAFKSKKLSRILSTRRKRLFFPGGSFKEEEFRKDLDRVLSLYQDNGYLDVRVTPEFNDDKTNGEMTILIHIDEGPLYTAGNVRLEGNIFFPSGDLWAVMKMLPDSTYSQRKLSQEVTAIQDYYFERGYISVQVSPETKINPITGKIDITYFIREGDLFFIDKVKIRGNTKTKDIVIRRELRVRPGERFDGAKIDRSKQRLENLGYFEQVNVETEDTDQANRKNLVVRVKEKQTGELSFGAGISSVEKFIGFAEIGQRNFDLLNFPRMTGAGQSLALRARVGSLSRDFDLSFTEPYLMGKNLSLGVNGYSMTQFANNTDFDTERTGGTVNISRAFGEYVKSGFGYTLENVGLSDIESDADPVVRQFEKDRWLSRVKWFINRDTRDNRFNPKSGNLLSFSSELVGSFIGGEEDFYVFSASWNRYYEVRKDHVLEFKLRLSTADSFGDSTTVPVYDRFYAGGLGSVRGYGPRRVGPKGGGDAIGGQSMMITNLEYTFPIIESFKGSFFWDIGQVDPDAYSLDFGDIAMSVGPGLKVNTPIGPVAFYYGYPLANKDTDNENGRFEFSFSRGF